MRRSDLFIKLTTAVLFLGILSYIGLYIFRGIRNTFETMPAVSHTIEEVAAVSGYIIRTETVIPGGGEMVLPVVDEGVRVGAGQPVAVEYLSVAALETASEIRVMRLRIAQIEASDGHDPAVMSLQSVVDLSRAVRTDDLQRLDELALRIETYIFENGGSDESELPYLQSRLAALEARSRDMRTIYAPESGIFSQFTDGFENISPQDITRDTPPSQLSEFFETPVRQQGLGKLITDHTWYYATVMESADAFRLTIGRNVPVQFRGAYNAVVNMRVEDVGRSENGLSLVLLSSDRHMRDIAPHRYLSADIIFGETEGIRVPKEAIHLDDYGATHIFIQVGVRAERVPVEILGIVEDSCYIVQCVSARISGLRPGATIIVRANNLSHGKIVG
jgi:multidrug efflux pump subunit AcrA (membrane-fusion protein)